ncbi:hypothetical protein Ae201684P_007591 [Aphanomyces euteiches]|nr:hypothetical protein Ae201684P_007591 [Aphanomyces euteiches]
MPDNTNNLRDIATNTIGMRREMTLPFEIPDDDVFDYYVQMPAAIFFGHGTRTFLTAFLTANETSRQDLKPWKWCQHQRLLGMPLAEICLWIDQLDVTRCFYLSRYVWFAYLGMRIMSSIVKWRQWEASYCRANSTHGDTSRHLFTFRYRVATVEIGKSS